MTRWTNRRVRFANGQTWEVMASSTEDALSRAILDSALPAHSTVGVDLLVKGEWEAISPETFESAIQTIGICRYYSADGRESFISADAHCDITLNFAWRPTWLRCIVLYHSDVWLRSGGKRKHNLLGFQTPYEAKPLLKQFCNDRFGSWHPEQRLWYVPLRPNDDEFRPCDVHQDAISCIKEALSTPIREHLLVEGELTISYEFTLQGSKAVLINEFQTQFSAIPRWMPVLGGKDAERLKQQHSPGMEVTHA